ncbi:hypothetical protein BCR34DRAFT_289876 [Clohesyomyces aquaticus]|uniref:Uncharacterized protein n=1 Tax=Clohesyomyces aquaticus TaxID=1231657 RepID=A0A1Y1ZQS9_9PLEO|nr:hypothetical protein BCR34DRAFT_289876 [Clohesyomyces aquaticus]
MKLSLTLLFAVIGACQSQPPALPFYNFGPKQHGKITFCSEENFAGTCVDAVAQFKTCTKVPWEMSLTGGSRIKSLIQYEGMICQYYWDSNCEHWAVNLASNMLPGFSYGYFKLKVKNFDYEDSILAMVCEELPAVALAREISNENGLNGLTLPTSPTSVDPGRVALCTNYDFKPFCSMGNLLDVCKNFPESIKQQSRSLIQSKGANCTYYADDDCSGEPLISFDSTSVPKFFPNLKTSSLESQIRSAKCVAHSTTPTRSIGSLGPVFFRDNLPIAQDVGEPNIPGFPVDLARNTTLLSTPLQSGNMTTTKAGDVMLCGADSWVPPCFVVDATHEACSVADPFIGSVIQWRGARCIYWTECGGRKIDIDLIGRDYDWVIERFPPDWYHQLHRFGCWLPRETSLETRTVDVEDSSTANTIGFATNIAENTTLAPLFSAVSTGETSESGLISIPGDIIVCARPSWEACAFAHPDNNGCWGSDSLIQSLIQWRGAKCTLWEQRHCWGRNFVVDLIGKDYDWQIEEFPEDMRFSYFSCTTS